MKKYVLSYTVYAINKYNAFEQLNSTILHSGTDGFKCEEVPFEDYEIKIIEEAQKMNYGGINETSANK